MQGRKTVEIKPRRIGVYGFSRDGLTTSLAAAKAGGLRAIAVDVWEIR